MTKKDRILTAAPGTVQRKGPRLNELKENQAGAKHGRGDHWVRNEMAIEKEKWLITWIGDVVADPNDGFCTDSELREYVYKIQASTALTENGGVVIKAQMSDAADKHFAVFMPNVSKTPAFQHRYSNSKIQIEAFVEAYNLAYSEKNIDKWEPVADWHTHPSFLDNGNKAVENNNWNNYPSFKTGGLAMNDEQFVEMVPGPHHQTLYTITWDHIFRTWYEKATHKNRTVLLHCKKEK